MEGWCKGYKIFQFQREYFVNRLAAIIELHVSNILRSTFYISDSVLRRIRRLPVYCRVAVRQHRHLR